jgi:hypothetical protein
LTRAGAFQAIGRCFDGLAVNARVRAARALM